MTRKTIVSILLLTLFALSSGCAVALSQNITGRGTVALQLGILPVGDFVPGEATFSLNFACYAQNNNRIQGNLTWKDPTNGVTLKATLPETPVKKLAPIVDDKPLFTTCKEMKALASELGVSVNTAGIWNENGNANGDSGTQVGQVTIVVAQPGVPIPGDGLIQCGPNENAVVIAAGPPEMTAPSYVAAGCLDHGKITFGPTQNQQ